MHSYLDFHVWNWTVLKKLKKTSIIVLRVVLLYNRIAVCRFPYVVPCLEESNLSLMHLCLLSNCFELQSCGQWSMCHYIVSINIIFFYHFYSELTFFFFRYLAKNSATLFSASDYEVAPPEYHRKAVWGACSLPLVLGSL